MMSSTRGGARADCNIEALGIGCNQVVLLKGDVMRLPRVWGIDLDDTLMPNSFTYNQPFVDFVQFLTSLFNDRIPYFGSIGRMQEDIDFGMAKEINLRTSEPYLYSRDRFPDSFTRAYKQLCENGFGTFDQVIGEHCREIGMRAFDEANYQKHGLVSGAEDVLNFLSPLHHLVLITKGDEWVQNKKIEALALHRWFSDIRIVNEKTCRVYLDIISSLRDKEGNGYTPADVVMVGNSFSSDIGPALEAGMNGVFIPCATWLGESVKPCSLPKDAHTRLVTLKKISEIIPWYQTLNS